MKVLYILNSTINGGATISFKNLIDAMPEELTPIIIVPQYVCPDFTSFLITRKIKYYQLPIEGMTWPRIYNWHAIVKYPYFLARMIYRNFVCIRSCKEIAKKENIDIIHTNVGTIHFGYYAAKALDIPHVWHLREYQDKDFAWNFFPTKKSFKTKLKDSYVISITHDILKYFDIDCDENAQCVYNGILHKDDIKREWPKKNFFVTANNLVPSKCMETTIRGFSEFQKTHKEYKLKICGQGSKAYVQSLKQLASDLDCEKNIEWLGFVRNITELLSYAKGLIVSSRMEGFGRMTAEACFMGCMPIGRNTGGTKEIIDYTGGILFNEDKELVKKMSEVCNMTKDEYLSIIDCAQRKAQTAYSIEACASNIYKIYLHILNK